MPSTEFDAWDAACHALAELSEGWSGNLYKRVGGFPKSVGVLVTGAVSPIRTRGPRKGTPNWPKRDRSTEREIFVSNEAYREAVLRLESQEASHDLLS